MQFEALNAILYSDTLVPDIFIMDYMPQLDGDYVKIYLYCLFLSKHNKYANIQEISKKLDISAEKVNEGIKFLTEKNILEVNKRSIVLVDLKEKEINKVYKYRTALNPASSAENSEKNKKKNQLLDVISKELFHGHMSPSWYEAIDLWFDRYKFDVDVMYTLLKYCYSQAKTFRKEYVTVVAENWSKKNIHTYSDLDNYFMEYEITNATCKKISAKLKLRRSLSEYEEEYVEKWLHHYKYPFEIIELALKKTVKAAKPSIEYVNAILTSWHKKGLKTKEEILESEEKEKDKKENIKEPKKTYSQKENFEQREYGDDFFEKLYKN